MKLNDKQKQFLFDRYYVTSKTLDALVEEGWQNYFIKNFDWGLSLSKNRWKAYDLELVSKETGYCEYELMINPTTKDYKVLMSLA